MLLDTFLMYSSVSVYQHVVTEKINAILHISLFSSCITHTSNKIIGVVKDLMMMNTSNNDLIFSL